MLVAQGVDPQRQKVERQRIAIDLAFKSYSVRFNNECLKEKWQSSHEEAKAMLDR
jgi:hypothetical protein